MPTKDHLKPSKELENEIMEFIFSKKCEDHRAALEIWENNPWIAVSMYETAHYPENLGLAIAFPQEVKVPKWYMKKLQEEEQLAMMGEPLYIPYPRARASELLMGNITLEVNKFGRVLPHASDEEESD